MTSQTLSRRLNLRGLALAILGVGALLLLPTLPAGPPDSGMVDRPDPAGAYGSPEPQRRTDDSGDSLLLLRNGRLLQGQITRTEDRYTVVIPGGEISVKASDVQQHCRDVAEAYRVKRAMARLDSVQDHIELAQWCHRLGLAELAAEELAEAKAIEPTHPMLPLVERQLKVALQPKDAAAEPAPPAISGPSVHDLDRMVRVMPPKTMETFAQVIQPMLVNHCGSAACHGPGAQTRFHLLRPPVGSLPSRRLTQRNLYAVLEWVDRDDPGKSPLLTIPTRPHGTARAPVFTNSQTAIFGHLYDWCYRVSRAQSPVVQASYEQPVGGGRNDPASASAARAALRAQRTQEREATKASMKQRAAQASSPSMADPAGLGALRPPDQTPPQPGPPETPGYSPASRAARPSPPANTNRPIPPQPD